MVVINVAATNCTPQTIVIGRRGTYDTMQIAFDLSFLIENYGSGTAVIAIKRSQDESAYPAVVTQEDSTLLWTVNETDTAYVGSGECQLMWYVDGGLAKTIIYPMVVMRDILTTAEEPPDGYENWVEHLTGLGAETQQNAQNAAQSASEAKASEDRAAESAQRAEDAAGLLVDVSATATTLEPGQAATAEYDEGVFKFGIPKGDKLTYADLTEADKEDLVQGPIQEAQTSAVNAVGAARVNAVNAVNGAGTTQVQNVNSAGTTNVNAVNQAGETQVDAVNQAGATQVQAVEDKGEEVLASIPSDYSDLAAEVDDLTRQLSDVEENQIPELKSALRPWFFKEFVSTSETIIFDDSGIKLSQGDTVIINVKQASTYGKAYIQGSQQLTDIKNVGTYTFTADISGSLMIGHRALDVDLYYPDFNVVSELGTSTAKAASQKLVNDAFDAVDTLDDAVNELSDQLDNKYDRYKVETKTGLSLSDFSICPPQYTIVQYDGTDALQHGAITGNIFSMLIPGIRDIRFVLHQVETKIVLAATNEKAVALAINAVSVNVSLYTASGNTSLSGIYRNANCPNVAADDTIHAKQDGTKIALYLVNGNSETPIFADEWVDIYKNYKTSADISESDVGLGFWTTTSQRNEPIIYDVQKVVISGDHFMPYDDVDARLSALEDGSGFNPYKVDLFMFMGQSNMAGRGTGSQAPEVIDGAGFEFRAISDPTKLYPITEPFGLDENVQGAIYDYLGGYKAKSGDLVPAFVNAYFENTHVSIVGVSASEGGTRISLWQPDTPRYTDALARFTAAKSWLESNGYTIRHKYMLWCQGESNGDDGMSKADYISDFTTMANAWFANGIEKIFVIKIGNYNGTGAQDYNTIMTAQNEICQTMQNVVMASTDFAGMKARDLMRDDFHYKQAAYNEVGTYAGVNVALYVNTEKEPTMYDTQDGSLYYSHKN